MADLNMLLSCFREKMSVELAFGPFGKSTKLIRAMVFPPWGNAERTTAIAAGKEDGSFHWRANTYRASLKCMS